MNFGPGVLLPQRYSVPGDLRDLAQNNLETESGLDIVQEDGSFLLLE
jgi:hypothetical protein